MTRVGIVQTAIVLQAFVALALVVALEALVAPIAASRDELLGALVAQARAAVSLDRGLDLALEESPAVAGA